MHKTLKSINHPYKPPGYSTNLLIFYTEVGAVHGGYQVAAVVRAELEGVDAAHLKLWCVEVEGRMAWMLVG